MFGRPYIVSVDDLPNPDDMNSPDLLDILGADFRSHGYDLGRLIQIIAASRPFLVTSTHGSEDPNQLEILKLEWAVFPLSRLRPDQVIDSMLQAASIKAVDQDSHLFVRTVRFFQENEFVQEYGDLGENEFDERLGTVSQALLQMNGELSAKMSGANPFNSVGRIAAMASTDEQCLNTVSCLSHSPPDTKGEDAFRLSINRIQGRGQTDGR